MRYCYAVWAALLLLSGAARAQEIDFAFLETRAEATGFEETTRYEEVAAFTDIVAAAGDRLFKTHFGYSSEGRALPLVVFGDVAGADPRSVRAAGKTRVYVQANIHAGEVCGKEALLMLLRALAAGQHAHWADSLVVLVAPIYNADGNERVGLGNRPRQNGPVGGMGQRANAQGYDLNRDHMKLDAPETRSLVRLLNAYDPHVVVDLHTTNGTAHAYHLTYAPPLHPNTPPAIDAFLRGRWLPAVTRRIRQVYGWETYYYGNLPWGRSDVERAWYTFDHRPRFNNNYAGLRGRFALLSEAYAYASFEERILATFYFVEEVLAFAYAHAGQIRAITRRADAQRTAGRTLALQARPKRSAAPVEILLGEVEEGRHPFTGEVVLRRRAVRRAEPMHEYGSFEATETETAPHAYLVPDTLGVVLDRLDAHGLRYRRLRADTTVQAERFRIDSTQVAARVYQGHRAQTVFGAYERAQLTLPAGTLLVPADQPLGRLAFALLEPRSDDGLLAWGLIEVPATGTGAYPIARLPAGR